MTEPVVVVLPAKIAAPLEFYQCEDCEDFPEDRYESVMEEAAKIEQEKDDQRSRVN